MPDQAVVLCTSLLRSGRYLFSRGRFCIEFDRWQCSTVQRNFPLFSCLNLVVVQQRTERVDVVGFDNPLSAVSCPAMLTGEAVTNEYSFRHS